MLHDNNFSVYLLTNLEQKIDYYTILYYIIPVN
jgi:hypothetical protein